MGDDGCVAAGATAKALGSRMGRDPARRLGSFYYHLLWQKRNGSPFSDSRYTDDSNDGRSKEVALTRSRGFQSF